MLDIGEGLNLDEPLGGEARLDDGLGAVAAADGVGVIFGGDEEALGFEIGEDALAGLVAFEARVGAAAFVDVRRVIHDVDGGEMVALADGEVVGVVSGRDFHGAGAELGVGVVVEDDGNLAADERQAERFAVEGGVARVVRIHSDGSVAEHGLGARGGDDDGAGVVAEWVADFPELAVMLFVNDLEVGDGGLAVGAPVDDVGAAIDEALLVEADEGFADGDGEALVHGEIFSLPIQTCAETLHLFKDGAAVKLLPLPDAFDEFFAAERVAGSSLGGELAFDEHLGGNAGVIGSGNPEGLPAEHALPAHDDVGLSLLEHVAHVEAAGDVGRREEDGEVVGGSGTGRDVEEIFLEPEIRPFFFDGGGVVGFRQRGGRGAGVGGGRGCGSDFVWSGHAIFIRACAGGAGTFQDSRA
jgi:hypothetical protein